MSAKETPDWLRKAMEMDDEERSEMIAEMERMIEVVRALNSGDTFAPDIELDRPRSCRRRRHRPFDRN